MDGPFGKKNRKSELLIRRQKQMDKIENSEISLQIYLNSIGALIFHHNKRVTKDIPLEIDIETYSSEQIHHIILLQSMRYASSLFNKSKNDSNLGKDIPSPAPQVNISLMGNDLREKRKKVRERKKSQKKKGTKETLPKSKLDLFDGIIPGNQRLQEISFVLSPSQTYNSKDGNCFMHAIIDQLRYDPIQGRL